MRQPIFLWWYPKSEFSFKNTKLLKLAFENALFYEIITLFIYKLIEISLKCEVVLILMTLSCVCRFVMR